MYLVSELSDLVFPAGCLCCGRPGAAWCSGCQPASVPRRVEHPAGPVTFAAGEYAEQLRTALIGYKERGRRQLAGPLAGYLADAVDGVARTMAGPARAVAGPAPPVLVPVPSRRAAARARGGDHVLRLARVVARQTALPMLPALRLAGPVGDSAGLSAGQRRANVAGRMAAVPPPEIEGRYPILLDDIVTTGATLAEAARALTAAGWPPAGAAVIAATRLRRPAGTPATDQSGGRGAAAPRRPDR